MKEKELLIYIVTWMNLTDIRLSKRSGHKRILFYLSEIQKQAKLIYGDRGKTNGNSCGDSDCKETF